MTIPWKNNTYRQKENQVTTERAQTVACKCVEGLPRCPSGEECLPTQEAQEMQVQSLGGKDPLEKEMATHPSNLAWRIPQTKEPGGLQSTGSQSQTHHSLAEPTLNVIWTVTSAFSGGQNRLTLSLSYNKVLNISYLWILCWKWEAEWVPGSRMV